MACTLDLNKVVTAQERQLRPLLGPTTQLLVEPAAQPAPIAGDPGMVMQLLCGLVDQAKHNQPAGGTVRVQIEVVNVDETHARLQPGARRGEFVRLSVTDHGAGWTAAETTRRLQAEAEATQTTLSLGTIAGIIHRQQGWLEVHSRPGTGTTVRLYFPPLSAEGQQRKTMRETILLVDDEVAIRRMVKCVLERASYEVVEADTGLHALSVWENCKDRVTLLLTDMVMPEGITGRHLAQRLRANKPELRVIYTSGFELSPEAQEDTAHRGVRFLQKPYDIHRLLQTVAEVIAQPSNARQPAPEAYVRPN
jgi:two-component system cell cycle sensor histidine kinase/response regulator CckA